jgi:hypothetical protein
MLECGRCGGGAPLTFTGRRWLCSPCWRDAFGVDVPYNGVRWPAP